MDLHTRTRTNVTLPVDLLNQAKAHRLVLSSVLEEALRLRLRALEAEAWKRDNAEALDAYSKEVEADGLFSDGLRSF